MVIRTDSMVVGIVGIVVEMVRVVVGIVGVALGTIGVVVGLVRVVLWMVGVKAVDEGCRIEVVGLGSRMEVVGFGCRMEVVGLGCRVLFLFLVLACVIIRLSIVLYFFFLYSLLGNDTICILAISIEEHSGRISLHSSGLYS